jgi:predicted MFS family arabinose efflux permease
MVEGKKDLTNAIGLNSAMFNGARAIGPALAGLAVAATGEGMAFFLNGLSFVAVSVCLLMMRNLPQSSRPRQDAALTSHMIEGVRFVFKQQAIVVLISLIAVSAFLSMPYNTLMPVFADSVLGQSAQPVVTLLCGGAHPLMRCQAPEALPLGILLTAVGIGAVAGALLVASLPENARRGRMLTVGNLAFPLVLLFFAASRSFVLSLALMILAGISFVWQNALANTLLQIVTPDELRGRVMSLYSLTFQGMMRVGGLQAGIVADWIGAPLSVGIGAAISLAYGLFVAVRFPKVREMA